MKTHFPILLINCLFLFINSVNAQQNHYNTLLIENPVPATFDNALPASLNADTATSACNSANIFWGIDAANGMLKEFDLTNNIITYTGNFVPSCAGLSLAICNTLNGGNVSPTFYTSQGNTAYYWDGANTWVLAGTASVPLHNASGSNNNLYFQSLGVTNDVVKYDGAIFSTIFSTSKLTGCADIAVDNNGNFIYVTFGGNSMSDSIFIISPTGQILNQYPFAVNVGNAYGCFLLNSVFYLALGSGNSVNPNSLIPVTFTGSSAIIGTPLSLPAGIVLTYDLASCNPGTLLGINESYSVNEISITPNPATDHITISGIRSQSYKYVIYDVTGQEVIKDQTIVIQKAAINVSGLKNGIYFIELKTRDTIIRRHFYKM